MCAKAYHNIHKINEVIRSSWCKWRKAEAKNTLNTFKHKPPLSDNVIKVIKPIYEELSSKNLLQRCLGAETQNSNESLNSMIWTFAPKHIHCGTKTVQIATFLAVSIFNEGLLSILTIMSIMGFTIGQQTEVFANLRDEYRIDRSVQRITEANKKARIAKQNQKSLENEFFQQEEGFLYGAGLAD